MFQRRTSAALATAVLIGTGAALAVGELGPLAGAQQEVPVSGPMQFNASGPARVYDSRTNGAAITSTGYGAQVIDLSGFVPAGTKGALLNVTVVSGGGSGYVSLTGERDPGTSNITWTQAGVFSNLAFVPVSDLGGVGLGRPLVALRYHGTEPIHVVIDLQSWIAT